MPASLVLAFVLAIAPGEERLGERAAPALHHVCPITGCKHACPRGEWRCEGKCIPKHEACRIT
ncbi:MAG TPA: hypothetical protein VGI95_17625 [Caulobacteraceae bacterium]|jgi:hypothetical protein